MTAHKDDVRPGLAIPAYEVVVEAEKMKLMAALLQDPTPIHFDTRALRALGMDERPVNQGPLNMGYLHTMLARWAGGRERVLDLRVRFLGNVLAGDRVRATGAVKRIEPDRNGDRAICDVALDVVGGATVLSGEAAVRVPLEGERSDEGRA